MHQSGRGALIAGVVRAIPSMPMVKFATISTNVKNNGGCDANAACLNFDGGSSCDCNGGYEGDGQSCGQCAAGTASAGSGEARAVF